MTLLEPLPFSWRLSRYEPVLRVKGTDWESWTDYSDIGHAFNGLTLTIEEYLRVENVYVDAANRFALESPTALFRVTYVGQQDDGFALSTGQSLVRSDLAPVVRGNLRGLLDCAVESADGGLQIAFGYDLYMYIASAVPCEQAVAESRRAGLHIESGVPLALWESGE